MDYTVIGYLIYLAVSLVLTVWVARVLARNGMVFIKDALHGDTALAEAINRLLQVGFYLLNLGFIAWWLKMDSEVGSVREMIEAISFKLGAVMLILGVIHVVNVVALSKIRRRGMTDARGLSRLEPPTRRAKAV